ncbi:hybrid sensor histidine kinase/response regulator [Magnetococcales bacterium HHB-1]
MSIGDDILAIFQSQVDGHLKELDALLLKLEKNPDHRANLEALMRTFHTIKGAARAIRFDDVKDAAHAMEDLFHALLHNETSFSPVMIDLSLYASDHIRLLLQADHQEKNSDSSPSLRHLVQTCLQGENPLALITPTTASEQQSTISETTHRSKPLSHALDEKVIDNLFNLSGELAVSVDNLYDQKRNFTSLSRKMARFEKSLNRFFQTTALRENEPLMAFQDPRTQLPSLLREIRNEYSRIVDTQDRFEARLQELSQNLYTETANTRLAPFEDVFSNYPRLLRDLSQELNKSCRLEIINGETRIDRMVLEAMRVSLTHALRNAIDHGIESAEIRQKQQKPAEGVITLLLKKEGDRILLEIRDDGAGIDREKLKSLLLERNLVSEKEWFSLTEQEQLDYLFHSGLTTATHVTEISGRGVGLDIIRTEAEKLGGKVMLFSQPGEGTTLALDLPIIYSATSSLLVLAGEDHYFGPQYYTFPIANLEGVERFNPEKLQTIEGRAVIQLEDETLPLFDFAQLIGLENGIQNSHEQHLLHIESGDNKIGLLVGKVEEEMTTINRSFDKDLGGIPGMEGYTLLRDNRLAFQVNMNALLQLISKKKQQDINIQWQPEVTEKEEEKKKHILAVEDSRTVREVAKHFLESAGFEVTLAVNGEDGLSQYKSSPYDLIMTDIDMPRMNGLTMIKEIRSLERGDKIPILVVSYKENIEDRKAALLAGADRFINKSEFDSQVVLDIIHDFIKT